ncbi:MAG: hypothetical protein WC205_02245 [Opitutaceae bacterium]|jgi:antitoxin (DNA-binding transcriptional repressor) of toxin-antitoxin stability system
MPTITIKELHERTGAWVRKAGVTPLQITDHGKLIAVISAPNALPGKSPRKRVLLKDYQDYLKSAKPPAAGKSLLDDLDAVRGDR